MTRGLATSVDAQGGTIGTPPTILVMSSFVNSTCPEAPSGSSYETRNEIEYTS